MAGGAASDPDRAAPHAAAVAAGRRPARLARRRVRGDDARPAGDAPSAGAHVLAAARHRVRQHARRSTTRSSRRRRCSSPASCAAVAFRMQLFNIGGEGQLYAGAIVGAAAGHRARQPLGLAVGPGDDRRRVRSAARRSRSIPAILRAFFSTNEIITSLMLNYVGALVINYLIFDSQSYWRDTSSPTREGLPAGQERCPTRRAGRSSHVGGLYLPFGLLLGVVLAAVDLAALHAHAVRVRGAGDRRLAARRDATPACARAGRSSP